MSSLSKIRTILKHENIDAALVSSVPNIIYLTEYAGFSPIEREAFVLITKKNQYIFTDSRYTHEVNDQAPSFSLKQLSAATPLSHHLKEILKDEGITSLGIEVDNITVAEYERLHKICKDLFPLTLDILRIQKTPEEIALIQEACNIGDQAFKYIIPTLKEGMTEKEVAYLLETYIRKTGNDIAFPSIVAFGKNAAIPHHKTDETRLKKNTFVLFDFGVLHQNYCSDMSRTIFFGTPTDEQKRLYLTVQESQEKSITYLESRKEKLMASEVDKVARDYIESRGYTPFPHALGHGIGIEVHEPPTLSPKSNQILTEGMVFSIEPGIYLPNKEGVRIEDLFMMQNNKPILLTKAPKELQIVDVGN